jgi:hypothetical protein
VGAVGRDLATAVIKADKARISDTDRDLVVESEHSACRPLAAFSAQAPSQLVYKFLRRSASVCHARPQEAVLRLSDPDDLNAVRGRDGRSHSQRPRRAPEKVDRAPALGMEGAAWPAVQPEAVDR